MEYSVNDLLCQLDNVNSYFSIDKMTGFAGFASNLGNPAILGDGFIPTFDDGDVDPLPPEDVEGQNSQKLKVVGKGLSWIGHHDSVTVREDCNKIYSNLQDFENHSKIFY